MDSGGVLFVDLVASTSQLPGLDRKLTDRRGAIREANGPPGVLDDCFSTTANLDLMDVRVAKLEMTRRTVLGAAGLLPFTRGAYGQAFRQVSMLYSGRNGPSTPHLIAEVIAGLAEQGWREPEMNFAVRYGDNSPDLLRLGAQELIGLGSDVLIGSSTPATTALAIETSTIPIIFASVSDPVTAGFVRSFENPGGNITGMTNLDPSLGGKWLQLLLGIAPTVRTAGLMYNPVALSGLVYWGSFQAAAIAAGLAPIKVEVVSNEALTGAVANLAAMTDPGLVVASDSYIYNNRSEIVAAAIGNNLPTVYSWPEFADDGGVLAYGVDNAALYRAAGTYAGRVLNGATPRELPVQTPTQFSLIINLRAAAAAGLTLPASLLALADRVIE